MTDRDTGQAAPSVGAALPRSQAFTNHAKWWIYRTEDGRCWDVSAPSSLGVKWAGVTEFPTGAKALAAFADSGAR